MAHLLEIKNLTVSFDTSVGEFFLSRVTNRQPAASSVPHQEKLQ